ncbi:MAG TPA: nucleotide exchange factor GrpE [Acidimicrobiales bacterium]|nr:nucleotide exchange factor GrpE [Acidimicrobiales bacterium]
MSYSDEAARNEEVPPESTPEGPVGSERSEASLHAGDPGAMVDGATWSEEDSAAVEAEAAAGAGSENGNGEVDPVKVLERERDEYLLALQRTQADFENYRKRIARQQDEQAARAAAALVNKLLPVLDTLDLAFAHLMEGGADSEDAKALVATRSMLLDVLAKEGLERVDEAGVPFDPMVHDAVSKAEDDGAGGESGGDDGDGDGGTMIDSVLRSGYRWRGQVVRPAMVSVRG